MIEKRWVLGSFVAGALSTLGTAMALVLTGFTLDQRRRRKAEREKAREVVSRSRLRPVR